MGNPNDENFPKSGAISDNKYSDKYLGSIKNKIYVYKKIQLVFQDGSPYLDYGNVQRKYEDGSPMPLIDYFKDYKFNEETRIFTAEINYTKPSDYGVVKEAHTMIFNKEFTEVNVETKMWNCRTGVTISNYDFTLFKTDWRDFPRMLVKAMTANTYFYTRLIEMSQKK